MAAVFSVFSVSWGIFGLLALWNVDLDPLSMAALLMAIGFSVDFTAHISYHYYKAPYGVSLKLIFKIINNKKFLYNIISLLKVDINKKLCFFYIKYKNY